MAIHMSDMDIYLTVYRTQTLTTSVFKTIWPDPTTITATATPTQLSPSLTTRPVSTPTSTLTTIGSPTTRVPSSFNIQPSTNHPSFSYYSPDDAVETINIPWTSSTSDQKAPQPSSKIATGRILIILLIILIIIMAWHTFINKAIVRYRRNRQERRDYLQSRFNDTHRPADSMIADKARGAGASTNVRPFVSPPDHLPFGTSSMSVGVVPHETRRPESSATFLTPPPVYRSAAGSSQASLVAAPCNSLRRAGLSPQQLQSWGRRSDPPPALHLSTPLPTSLGLSEGAAADTPPVITDAASATSDYSPIDTVSARPVDEQGMDGNEAESDTERKRRMLEKVYERGSYQANSTTPQVCEIPVATTARSKEKYRLTNRSSIERDTSMGKSARLVIDVHPYYKDIPSIEESPDLREVADESGSPSDEVAQGDSSTKGTRRHIQSVYDSIDLSQCKNEAEVRSCMANLQDHSPLLKDANGRDLVPLPVRERANSAASQGQLSQQVQIQPVSPETSETPALLLGKYHENESFIISDTDDDDDDDKGKKRFEKLSQLLKAKRSKSREKEE